MRRILVIGCTLVAAATFSACSSNSTPSATTSSSTTPTTAASAGGGSADAALKQAVSAFETGGANGVPANHFVIAKAQVSSVNPDYGYFVIAAAPAYVSSFQGFYGFAQKQSDGTWKVVTFGTALVGCPVGRTTVTVATVVVIPSAVLQGFGQSCPSTTTTTVAPASLPKVPMQTATGGEFLSPSGNISCEINSSPPAGSTFANGQPIQPYAMCLTVNPAQSATLTADGTVTDCSGSQCLSNAGENTPTLAYGTATGAGPFTCVSATAGMTCTVTSGKGFQIARAGITPVG